jgi:hypothetical protein
LQQNVYLDCGYEKQVPWVLVADKKRIAGGKDNADDGIDTGIWDI